MQAQRNISWALSDPEVIAISGRLDSGTAPQTEEKVMQRIGQGARDIILDCSDLNFTTGAGLRMILTLAKEMQKVSGKLAVCNLHSQAQQIFEACHYDNIIPVFSTRDRALAALAA